MRRSKASICNLQSAILAALLAVGLLALAPRAEAVWATGGTVTNYTTGTAPNETNWTAHIFTNSVNDTLTTNLTIVVGGSVEVLVVAGGGGGGRAGGGGGAGGLIYSNVFSVVSGSNYTVTVGAGGAGSTDRNTKGGNGSNSSFGSILATGGGGGGCYLEGNGPGMAGGSGGGGTFRNNTLAVGQNAGGSASPAGQGFAGGSGSTAASPALGAGGGGGAGTAGGSTTTDTGGNGGAGLTNSISGTATPYAGGGGGGATTTAGTGGAGGGGNGSVGTANATAGTANTGGGGGGSRDSGGGNGGDGGRGIVIVRYVSSPTVTLTAPMNNQLFFSGSTITATAAVHNASETSTVRFYTNTASGISFGLAGTVASSPYELNLGSSLAVTNYLIYATASNATDGVFTTDTNAFLVREVGPVVTNVTSTTADGAYKAGVTINVQVMFDTAVTVAGGTPRVKLETGGTDRYANFTGGSGTDTLTFEYEVDVGDTSADLDYSSTSALELNGATIKDTVSSADAILELAAPGAETSLGFNKALVIDTTAESVINVTSAKSDGTYKAAEVIDITVEFNGTVQVTDTPQLELETGDTDRKADYLSGSPGTTLTFRYTVQAGDASDDLDYTGVGALTLPGGATITDAAGNDATLTLAAPGAAGSLGANKALVIDALAETLDSIDNNDADNAVNTYDILTYTLTFSDDILHTTVDATDFDNAAASPSLFTVFTITETTPGVFSVQVRPTTAGNLKLRVKSDAVITDPIGNQVSNLPVSDGETIVVKFPTPWASGGVGGTLTEYRDDDGQNWVAHIFTNVGSSNITFSSPGLVEYLIVAGGGGGGPLRNGGGGGAGAVLQGVGLSLGAGISHAVTVGNRGAGGTTWKGGTGGTSSFEGSFGLLTVPGGGGGGRDNATDGPGADGGCGGGGAPARIGGDSTAVSPQQGNDGGDGSPTTSVTGRTGGGGGGAGGPGGDGAIGTRGAKGLGITSFITGEEVTYATGGLGGVRLASGAVQPDAQPPNTGNGGDGASGSTGTTANGGDGGSGIVVIRYAIQPAGTLLLVW